MATVSPSSQPAPAAGGGGSPLAGPAAPPAALPRRQPVFLLIRVRLSAVGAEAAQETVDIKAVRASNLRIRLRLWRAIRGIVGRSGTVTLRRLWTGVQSDRRRAEAGRRAAAWPRSVREAGIYIDSDRETERHEISFIHSDSSDYSKKQLKDIIFALLLWARACTMLR